MNETLSRRRPAATREFLLIWILLVNLPFMLLWWTGGPPRTLAIALYFAVGVFLHRAPAPVIAIGYLVVLGCDVASVLANLFNLTINDLVFALRYVGTLQPFDYSTYAIAGLAVAVTAAAVIYALARPNGRWRDFAFIGPLFAMVCVLAMDAWIQFDARYTFGRYLASDAPFDSALDASGLRHSAPAPGSRQLLVVMVESWGALRNEDLHREIVAPVANAKFRSRYRLSQGTAPFYGSTTAAELRELCGYWGSYRELNANQTRQCLPAAYRARGHDATAFHGFTGRMFDRTSWYPVIGFTDMRFADSLWNASRPVCRGVFTGMCDTDIASDVAEQLLAHRDAPRPQLVYWLTLNSHLPVDLDIPLRHRTCDRGGDQQLCRMADLWQQVFTDVADMLLHPDLPPTDAILIGDHPPPFWRREERSQFQDGLIPWVRLEFRGQPDPV